MAVYPLQVFENAGLAERVGDPGEYDAAGADASFSCGSFIRFYIKIESESKRISNVTFRSNGCGYMIAAAAVIENFICGKALSELHGLGDSELWNLIVEKLGVFPAVRFDCAEICLNALRTAFANYRTQQLNEFQGEKALICTCFGVSDEAIESAIQEYSMSSVREVMLRCRAGSGCGSCRFLIQEIIDKREI